MGFENGLKLAKNRIRVLLSRYFVRKTTAHHIRTSGTSMRWYK